MLKFLIDNIFVMFGIHMGTNCARLLTDLLLYSYEEDFIQVFLSILSLVILLITSIPLILK